MILPSVERKNNKFVYADCQWPLKFNMFFGAYEYYLYMRHCCLILDNVIEIYRTLHRIHRHKYMIRHSAFSLNVFFSRKKWVKFSFQKLSYIIYVYHIYISTSIGLFWMFDIATTKTQRNRSTYNIIDGCMNNMCICQS